MGAEIQSFLARVLPVVTPAQFGELQQCYYMVGLTSGEAIPTSVPFIFLSDAQSIAQRLAGQNIYIALASYKDATFGRKTVNASQVKCLWLDIDVGKPSNSYPSLDAAFDALEQFVSDTRLTPSIIVHSGVGLQAYWTFTKPIEAQAWKQLATVFEALTVQQGLIVDPSRTKDVASIMRLPGTIHQKSGNVASVLADSGTDWKPKALLETMMQTMQTVPQLAPLTPTAPTTPALMEQVAVQTGMAPRPLTARAEPVVMCCPAITAAGLSSEPQWFAAMSVLRSCVDGLEWAHKVSATDPDRYDPQDTERKFYHAQENAPARCSTFKNIAPEFCAQCQYRGQFTSPIQLGVQRATVIAPEAAPEAAPATDHLVLPEKFDYAPIPLNSSDYIVDGRGITWIKREKSKDGEWSETPIHLCTSQIFYTHSILTYEDAAPRRTHWFLIKHQCGKEEHVPFVIQRDMTLQGIMRWFNEANVFAVHPSTPPQAFMGFMNTYLQSVLSASIELTTLEKFGWTEIHDPKLGCETEGFALGAGVITETGLCDVAYGGVANKLAKSELGHAGTLEEWKKIPQMYSVLDQKEAQLAVCLSFAAPLMKYGPGLANNGVFSLWSTKSGMGKSQVMRACAGIWGDPDKQFIQRHSSDTLRMRKLATLANLPSYMDELTDVANEDMYALAYTLAGGQEKQKLKRSGADMVDTGEWQTTVFITANRSFKEAAAQVAGDSDASLLRVMEVECTFDSYIDQPEIREYINYCIGLCRDNYGIAGAEFVYQLMRHKDRLRTLTAYASSWALQHEFAPSERYTSTGLALALKAGRWAVEWGLLDYDMDALEAWVLQKFVPHNRAAIAANKTQHLAAFKDYLLQRQLHTVIVTATKRPSGEPAAAIKGMPDKYIITYPQKEVYVRLECREKIIRIALSDLRYWCKQRGLSVQVMQQQLKEQGLKFTTRQFSLSSDIFWAMLPAVESLEIRVDSLEDYLGYTIRMPEGK